MVIPKYLNFTTFSKDLSALSELIFKADALLLQDQSKTTTGKGIKIFIHVI
jgi:hypothetical protein